MRLDRKLTLGVLGLFVPPAVAAALTLLALHRRGVLDQPPVLVVTVVIGLGGMMLYLAVVAHGLGRSLVRTIEEIRHGAELISTVNPEHRLDVRTGDDLQALAAEINHLAEHLRTTRQGLADRVAGATRELEAERGLLSTILDELAEGVVVAGADGRVTLANRRANQLLRDSGAILGSNLFELADGEALVRHLAALRRGERGVERFTLRTTDGAVLQVAMTALSGPDAGATGIILTLRDQADGLHRTDQAPESPRAGSRFKGIGLHSGSGAGVLGPPNSELYDFSLFEQMERNVGPAEREHRLDGLTFVVFDTETTGLRPETGDRIVSLAAVRVRSGRIRRHEAFDTLVDPGRSVPPDSRRIHGITDEMLIGAPPMETVLPAFLQFAGPAVLVAHEASFDLRFLEPEARRLGLPSLAANRAILDTRLLSWSLHGPGESHSLEAVARRLGVTVTGRHSALGDALTTAEVLVRLLALVQKRGVLTLGQMLDAVRGARRVMI